MGAERSVVGKKWGVKGKDGGVEGLRKWVRKERRGCEGGMTGWSVHFTLLRRRGSHVTVCLGSERVGKRLNVGWMVVILLV
jgi:hypothetical protein